MDNQSGDLLPFKVGQLPFKVGQLAESRSFILGFRGAWFRCKIKEIRSRQGKTELALEFFDFPDDKIKWLRLYQVSPNSSRSKGKKRVLMLRPQYPPICHESQLPPGNTISEVTVVNSGVWKVGDLVDWLSDGCYWSGRVTYILGNDKVQIELPRPPEGEGSSYEVFCKDLRPSLEWSPEHGWSVPTFKEGENCRPFARLIKPMNQAGLPNLETTAVDSSNSLPSVGISKDYITKETNIQPLINVIPKGDTQAHGNLDMGNSVIGETSLSQSLGHVRDASAEPADIPAGEGQDYGHGPMKKMKTGGNISLNSMCSDTLEAPILDLEELVLRVKWLKSMLEFGVPLSNPGRPPWKFMEHHASSMPK